MANLTKNDIAWNTLFARYDLLTKIRNDGYFEITAAQINEERESRLMAKFDHSVNLPAIFKEHHLSILPLSRTKYIVGPFRTHFTIASDLEKQHVFFEIPHNIESISFPNLNSESLALNYAYIAGLITDFLGEEAYQTLSGRMSTGCFGFTINNRSITVENSQCEIDAGFESDNYLLLIEAKNYAVDDFLIRQLYYPFRLWSSKVHKKVIPVLMTFSNDTFTFYEFQFTDISHYSSLILTRAVEYSLQPEPISSDDIMALLQSLSPAESVEGIPFPQADKFERVIDLLGLLTEKELTKDDITENYQFDIRQTQYYTDAGRYLGLIDKTTDGDCVTFRLTDNAIKIFNSSYRNKYLGIIAAMLNKPIFYAVFKESLHNGAVPSRDVIVTIMQEANLSISGTTITRRASTVSSWVNWIWGQIEV
ncbi:type II restriction enzyme [Leptothoe sp. PORK10 BA2]|uniref:type II restriction enzyme n=1 Tax=Leptothoe sp. PORK10 BA2 TaxID=3110254 RepID=UPI002B20A4AC|nr:hypothetical protein [Leptothoe sp. PORK10 BA2]MEA5466993.1 hypothetical protein [Leptothoe sp. PORK10 BA2]